MPLILHLLEICNAYFKNEDTNKYAKTFMKIRKQELLTYFHFIIDFKDEKPRSFLDIVMAKGTAHWFILRQIFYTIL